MLVDSLQDEKKTKNKTRLLVVCSSYQHNLCESCGEEGVRPLWLAELLPPGLVCGGAEMW